MKVVRKEFRDLIDFDCQRRLRRAVQEAADYLGIRGFSYEKGPWIAGGFVTRTIFQNQAPNKDIDIDIWASRAQCTSIDAHLIEERDKNKSRKDGRWRRPTENSEYAHMRTEIENPVRFLVDLRMNQASHPIQLMDIQQYDIYDVFETFDLSCSMVGTDGECFFGTEEAFYDLNRGEFWQHIHWRSSTIHRIEKYKELGLKFRGSHGEVHDGGFNQPMNTRAERDRDAYALASLFQTSHPKDKNNLSLDEPVVLEDDNDLPF